VKRKKLKELVKKINRDHGDALVADKVIAQARNIGRVIVVPGTAAHRIQEISLRENVLCVIDKPFRLTEGAMRLKK
jgi:hypothetical protein